MIKVSHDIYPEMLLAGNNRPNHITITHIANCKQFFYDYHAHENAVEIIFVAQGQAMYTVKNVAYHVSAGDVLLINPNVLHSVSSDPGDDFEVWALAIRNLCLPGLPEYCIIAEGGYPVVSAGERAPLLTAMFEKLLEEDSTAPLAEALRYNLTETIILLVCQLKPNDPRPISVSKESVALDVLAHINTHFRDPLTLDSIAAQFHMSAGHLSHLLSKECGTSPINYLINRRIGEAQWLLVTTRLTVNEISEKVGYRNPYHFTSIFTKRIGISPQSFREKNLTRA